MSLMERSRRLAKANRDKEKQKREKKLIDAIIEDKEEKKKGFLSSLMAPSVEKRKRNRVVASERKKEGKPPETRTEKATRQRQESDEAKAKKQKLEKQKPEIEVGPPPKVIALKPKGPKGPKEEKVDPTSTPVSKKDPTGGGRFAFYPGEISRKEGYETMYEVDRNKMSDEVRERLEEAELYEGDSKGGRVGKGKKKKVSKAPRGVRAALRGFKPKMGAGKGNKRTRGTGGGWV